MFLSPAEEYERNIQRQSTYGESPDWIRRVLQAYYALEEARWRRVLQQATQGSLADVPVGQIDPASSSQQPESPSLSQVGTAAATTTTVSQVSGASSGQQAAQNQAVVHNIVSQSGARSMDLGNIITTLGSAYITARYGQPAPQYPYMQQPVGYPSTGDVYGMQPTPAFFGAGLPALATGALTTGSLGGRIASAVAGLGLGLGADELAAIAGAASKVKCRRRRRRLATHSDIKDLAALKAVLGSGKAFDTWIATRKM